MAAQCYAPVKGKVIRATQLDACGKPVLGAGDWPVHVVSKGFISVEYEPEIDDGEDIEQRNADGELCVSVPACPTIKWMNITVSFCQVDPELYSLMTGVPVVLDPDGAATGFRIRKTIQCDGGVALETWTGVSGARCTAGSASAQRYGYFLVPWLTQGVIQAFTIENGAATFQIKGRGVDGGLWGTGPFAVYRTGAGVTAKLAQPIGDGDLVHADLTTLPPPAPSCGVVPRPTGGS
jgi:hypothetical protein